jgi:hypothetical protein
MQPHRHTAKGGGGGKDLFEAQAQPRAALMGAVLMLGIEYVLVIVLPVKEGDKGEINNLTRVV